MPEISKIKLTSGDEYNIKDTTAREMISSHTHTNESMGFGYSVGYPNANYSYFCGIIDDYTLTDGDIIIYEFEYNVPANATLNINNTGDKPIYYNGSAITDGIINAGDTVILKYNENLDLSFSRFDFIGLHTVYTEYVNNSNSQEEINIYAPYLVSNGQNFNIRFDYDVPAYATLNINNMGEMNIFYNNGSLIKDGIIKAGDTATFIYNNNDYRCDLLATDNYNNENVNHYYYAMVSIDYRISLDGYTQTKGGIVSIKFDYEVLAGATLNINNTGAKPIYYNDYTIDNDIIKSGDTATFIYDGTNYNLISLDRDFNPITVDSSLSTISTNPVQNSVITNALNNKADNTHTHSLESLGIAYGECDTERETTAKTVSISNYKLTTGGIVSVKFTYSVPANATLNISGTGAKSIYHNGHLIRSDIIKAGDIATFIYDGTNYNLISLDRNFNFTNESMGFGYSDINYSYFCGFINNINIYNLTDGDIIIYRFYNDVLLENATLDINNMGEIDIFYNDDIINDGIIKAGDTAILKYDNISYNLLATNNINNESMGFGYGTCSTAASTTTKTVSISNYTLSDGGIVFIKFDYNVLANTTLNINNTGAKSIYYNGAAITDNIIKAGETAILIYDGTNDGYNLLATNNYNNENVNHYYNASNDYRITLFGYTLTKDGIVSIKFDYNVLANATLNISNTGSKFIYYKHSAITDNIIKAGDTATFIYDGIRYNLISLDRDFNDPITVDSSLSTTSTNPVENNVITNALDNKADSTHTHSLESLGIAYGECDTAASATTKTVSISNYKLSNGGIVSIIFYYAVPAGSKLNINSTGAKPIVHNGSLIKDGIIKKGDTVTFIYDGTNYNLISFPITVDSSLSTTSNNPVQNNVITNALNTHTHTNESMGFGYGVCSTAASTTAKTVSIPNYELTKGGIVSIKFDYAVPAGSTLNINSTGAKSIVYNSSTIKNNVIKAGDTATFIYYDTKYKLISLDRDFNPITVDSSLSTTSNNPVQNNVITNALNNYIPTIVGTQIESTNNWTGNAQFETLEDGQRILYYLPYDNSSGSDVVLNLTLADGTTQTGSINCYLSGSTRLNSQYEAGNFIPLIYKENIAFNGSSTTYTGWWAYTDKDIDSKVQNTLNNTTKAYITGTTSASTNTGTQIFDTGVYLENTAGNFHVEGTVNGAIPYGDCSTAADTAAKTVTVPGTFSLVNGARVTVRFTVTNSADNPTLNVNNTGAKPILYRGSRIKSYLAADRTYQFIYNSDLTFNSITGVYEVIGDLDTSLTYTNVSLGNGYAICTTESNTAVKTATLSNYNLIAHGIVSVYFQNAVTGEATLNINSQGAKQIVYVDSGTGNQNSKTSTTGYIKAGSIATFVYDGTYYRCIARDATDNPESVSTDAASVGSAANQYARADHKHSLADVALNSSISAGTLADNSTFTVVNSITTNRAGQVEGIVSSTYTLSDTKSSILYGEISATNASITTTNKNIHVIKFNYNVSDNENLTINNTQYPIYYNGNAITSGIINNGDIAMFIQDDINQYYNLIFINKSNT